MLKWISRYLLLCLSGAWFYTCLAKEFRLGMLSPFRHVRLGWENNAAAATIAIEKAQTEGLLAGHNITVKWRDDGCSALKGAGNIVLLRDQDDVDAFIGPPCSSATTPAGLLASFWNMPMFSQASSDPSLSNKAVYKTLVRLGPPFNKMGKAFVEICNTFGWSRVVIVSRRRTDNRRVFCDYSSRAAETTFRENNITLADLIIIEDGIDQNTIDKMLIRIQQRGRVVILCTENTVDRRLILVRAQTAGMMDGSYIFFLPDHLPAENVRTPWVTGDASDAVAKLAYTFVFQITVAEMAGPEVEAFRDLVPVKMAEPPWNYNKTLLSGTRGSLYSPFLHDVVYLYLLLLDEAVKAGMDHRNGTLMFQKAQGQSFRGVTGNVLVDNNGDREPDYWIWDLKPGGQFFNVVIEARMTSKDTKKIHILDEIVWGTPDGKPPLDVPLCGFMNEFCPEENPYQTTIVVVSVLGSLFLVTIAIVAVVMYRRSKLEREIEMRLWQIPYSEIKFTKSPLVGSISSISLHTIASSKHGSMRLDTAGIGEGQVFSSVGYYKGNTVAIKRIADGSNLTAMSRAEMLQLKAMRDQHHENVNAFIGICVDDRFPCWVTHYCSKGSLEDIIGNDDIHLDWMFKMSLLNDLVNGLCYMHPTPLHYHGNLKSSNCVVDNRWVLKLTDFGMKELRLQTKKLDSDYKIAQGQFWTSPELLRSSERLLPHGQQKADVYSFAVIMFEILYRRQPYDTFFDTPEEVIQKVKAKRVPPYRPHVEEQELTEKTALFKDAPEAALKILYKCWDENPESRPSVSSLKHLLLSLNKGRKVNIVDNMIRMLEKYANNLEEIVEQRTSDLIDERKKSDTLLYRMLPRTIADKLKSGTKVDAEIFDCVTVYFSDIVGFTDLSSRSTPIQVVDLLNDLYTMFDSTISTHNVYKVETIGDAYMVVSGLPDRNGNKHVTEIANMALDLLQSIWSFKVTHCPAYQLKLRIGLHSGSCAAGVVGRTMPRYCLFGDTVNMASRMESNGQALKIHMSQDTGRLLTDLGGYDVTLRGEMEIKGKGTQTTYWLSGKDDGQKHVSASDTEA